MVRDGLDRLMRRVLAELELTSCGVTASFDTAGGGAYGSRPPKSGDRTPPHVYYREQWALAEDDDRRREVLGRAIGELRAIRKAPPPRPEETEQQRARRLLEDGEGWTAREVALTFRMTESQVRKVRTGHGRDPERGMVKPMRPMPDATPEERRERVRLLAREHKMSMREIALVIGVSHETVRRDMMWRGEGRAA